MKRRGPIVIIDDDTDDREILTEILESLNCPNEIVSLANGDAALEYLKNKNVNPFLVISDINMPKMNGYELRQRILNDECLRRKCVPFIFFTTSGSDETISRAYEHAAQGFFHKRSDYLQYKEAINDIIKYWMKADTPEFPNPHLC